MFTPLRRAVFGASGGFAITDFYLSSVPSVPVFHVDFEDDRANAPTRSRWWWPFGSSYLSHQQMFIEPPELTFREDLTALVQENQNASMVATAALVLVGGPWALAGSALAMFSDTQEGLNLYLRVKDWFEGNQ